MIRMLLSFWFREDIFHVGISSPAFKKRRVSVLLALAIFQVPLTLNNLYATVAYFVLAYSAIHQVPENVLGMKEVKKGSLKFFMVQS